MLKITQYDLKQRGSESREDDPQHKMIIGNSRQQVKPEIAGRLLTDTHWLENVPWLLFRKDHIENVE